MHFTFDVGTVLGFIGAIFYVCSFVMKSMIPLRTLALVGNLFFIGYGYFESALPTLALHLVLFPLNAQRLREIYKLTTEIRKASHETPVSEWLLPHMTRRSFKAGEVLFRKGEHADVMVYLVSGKLRIQEFNQILEPGDLVGEIGLFSPERARTQTVVCETDGELYMMTDEMAYRLYYQNPKLGFYFMRLVAERLLRDTRRAELVGAQA
jgi:hypothetical protein